MGLSVVPVSLWREPNAQDLPLPSAATTGSAGLDLSAALESDLTVLPGQRVQISTGICIGLPEGFEAQVRPRSGLALNYGLTLLNSPGTIDADYRGVIHVIVVNLGQEPIVLRRGDRIAQLVVAPVVQVAWAEATDKEMLTPTQRGEGGFGSSGR